MTGIRLALIPAAFWLATVTTMAVAQTADTRGPCSPVVQGTQGTVTINFTGGCGNVTADQLNAIIDKLRPLLNAALSLSAEHDRLVREYSLTDAAVQNFFKTLGENHVAPEDRDHKFREFAAKYKQLEAQVAQLPQNSSIAKAADVALHQGELDRAETLVSLANDQLRAVQLIDNNHPDQAIKLLDDVEARLDKNYVQATPRDRLQRGYDYKTYAEAFAAKGDKAAVDRYLALALNQFEQVRNDPKAPMDALVGAFNGIGNVFALRGEYRKAIANYQLATGLISGYAYAWHDMFLTYVDMAQHGDVDIEGMRHALDETKINAKNTPGLDDKYLATLEAIFARYAHSPSGKPQPPGRPRP